MLEGFLRLLDVKVLVIEDEPHVARNLERALLRAGHVPESACGGLSGLALAESETYDLILLDVLLTGLGDGLLRVGDLTLDPRATKFSAATTRST